MIRIIPTYKCGTIGLNIAIGLILFLITGVSVYGESNSLALIQGLKENAKGPFDVIKWYCPDGQILPAQSDGCGKGIQGFQHGKLREDVVALRQKGFPIANLFIAITPADIENFSAHPRALAYLILERYLYFRDDGWIYRKARSYRGAVQSEDESRAAHNLLLRLSSTKAWRTSHYLLLREAVKFFPRQFDSDLVTQIRSLATKIASADSSFKNYKDRLHAFIDPNDAEVIRSYAAKTKDRSSYERLASLIDTLHSQLKTERILEAIIPRLPKSSATEGIKILYQKLGIARSYSERYIISASILHSLRSALSLDSLSAEVVLDMLYASLAIEEQLIAAHPNIISLFDHINLNDGLNLLAAGVDAAYGTGLISEREFNSAFSATRSMSNGTSETDLENQFRYLGLLPAWSTGEFNWEFGIALQKLQEIEPLVRGFIADRIRAGPLALYAPLLSSLMSKSVSNSAPHEIFGSNVSGELYALSSGVARGGLKVIDNPRDLERVGPDDILFTAENISELPKIKGIITVGGMNALSHIQLLAMNLGIPHVSVDGRIADILRKHNGDKILLGVFPDGKVVIDEDSSPYDPLEPTAPSKQKKDVAKKKVDTTNSKLFTLNDLSIKNSGIIVGPKAANLAMLKKEYPDHVANAVVIPFGVFGKVFELPCAGEKTLVEYITSSETTIKSLPQAKQKAKLSELLASIRSCIARVTFTDKFEAELSQALQKTLGSSYLNQGVFVRSDTNVEDLPGFTGAGLNRTIPNVKSFKEILQAIRDVWQSPFSERAVGWRADVVSSLTDLFVSVIVQHAVPVEKSGVLITADVHNSNLAPAPVFTVAVNEGVGGAVDNQWAESLLVSQSTGEVWVYSEASSPTKKILNPKGGVSIVETLLSERVLTTSELSILSHLADEVPDRFSEILKDGKDSLPADVEFGFLNGRLSIFQIRPLRRSVVETK